MKRTNSSLNLSTVNPFKNTFLGSGALSSRDQTARNGFSALGQHNHQPSSPLPRIHSQAFRDENQYFKTHLRSIKKNLDFVLQCKQEMGIRATSNKRNEDIIEEELKAKSTILGKFEVEWDKLCKKYIRRCNQLGSIKEGGSDMEHTSDNFEVKGKTDDKKKKELMRKLGAFKELETKLAKGIKQTKSELKELSSDKRSAEKKLAKLEEELEDLVTEENELRDNRKYDTLKEELESILVENQQALRELDDEKRGLEDNLRLAGEQEREAKQRFETKSQACDRLQSQIATLSK